MPRPQTATSNSSPPGEDRAVATTDQPAEIGPFVVTKGQMLTGPQFYARQEERRGTRLLLDDALSWALWVNGISWGRWPAHFSMRIGRSSLKRSITIRSESYRLHRKSRRLLPLA